MKDKRDFLAVEVITKSGDETHYHPAIITRDLVAGVMDLSYEVKAENGYRVVENEGCQIALKGDKEGNLCNCNKPYSFVKRWLFGE